MKQSLREYSEMTKDNKKAIENWMMVKKERGENKWDFVNGYYGEKYEMKIPFQVLLARATEGGKIERNCGMECLKIEKRDEYIGPENNLEKAKKFLD